MDLYNIKDADGLDAAGRETLEELVYVLERTQSRNRGLRRYYDGDVVVEDYGLRITSDDLPNDQVCFWPEAAVDKLAERIRLDGFVTRDGQSDDALDAILMRNDVVNAYADYLPSKLMHGCAFAAVNRHDGHARVRFHSAETASALESDEYETGTVSAGMCIAASRRTEWSRHQPVPTQVNMYVPGRVTVIERVAQDRWEAESYETREAAPMLVSFTHRANGLRPFGKSRISRAVRCLTRDAVRTMYRMGVLGAFYSMPSRALLGLTDEQYDAMANNKTKAYLDSMLLSTRDDDGNVPTYMQLAANSPQPLIEQLRFYASMFSGATGVPLNSLGVTTDNPSSAQAISAAREDICNAAELDIARDAESLRRVVMLALAVEQNVTTGELPDAQRDIVARFRPPTMASTAANADAAVKISGADARFAGSPVFYEMLGVSQADQARIEAYAARAEGRAILNGVLSGS